MAGNRKLCHHQCCIRFSDIADRQVADRIRFWPINADRQINVADRRNIAARKVADRPNIADRKVADRIWFCPINSDRRSAIFWRSADRMQH